MHEKIRTIVFTICATILILQLTPLRWISLIDPTINDIAPRDFQTLFLQNPSEYIFIDVRPESAYKAAHAVGSKNMPLHTLYDERHVLPKRGKTIVLICSGGRASGVGYHYLEHFGFLNLMRIEGGIENWILEGLPVEGANIPSLQDVTSGKEVYTGNQLLAHNLLCSS
jgi:rhodanese-related sulfurtransferase